MLLFIVSWFGRAKSGRVGLFCNVDCAVVVLVFATFELSRCYDVSFDVC